MEVHSNIIWHEAAITKHDRQLLNNHKSCVLWFTGLSGSGKSTIANALDKALYEQQCRSYVLDGDNIRHGLNKDLGFLPEDRRENIRRLGELTKLFVDCGMITISALISPFQEDRAFVRELFDENEFIEIYLRCPLHICEKRDPKNLYRKARQGEIANFTGISSPYEEPLSPEMIIDTDQLTVEQSVQKIISFLKERQIIYPAYPTARTL